jgi:hypothetical protein
MAAGAGWRGFHPMATDGFETAVREAAACLEVTVSRSSVLSARFQTALYWTIYVAIVPA